MTKRNVFAIAINLVQTVKNQTHVTALAQKTVIKSKSVTVQQYLILNHANVSNEKNVKKNPVVKENIGIKTPVGVKKRLDVQSLVHRISGKIRTIASVGIFPNVTWNVRNLSL